MKSRVMGLSAPPSIFWIRPFSTVTSSEQESGQSSGHAVRTVEWPHVSRAAVRGIPALSNAECRMANAKCQKRLGIRHSAFSIRHSALSIQHSAVGIWHLLLDVGAFAACTHVDAGRPAAVVRRGGLRSRHELVSPHSSAGHGASRLRSMSVKCPIHVLQRAYRCGRSRALRRDGCLSGSSDVPFWASWTI